MIFMFWFIFIMLSFILTVAIFGSVNVSMSQDDRVIDLIVAIIVFVFLSIMNLSWYR